MLYGLHFRSIPNGNLSYHGLFALDQRFCSPFIFGEYISWIALLFAYTVVVSFKKETYKKILTVISFVWLVGSVCLIILPIEFFFNPGDLFYSYTYGPAVGALKVLCILFLMFSIICMLIAY